jgi:hypothetical protein
MQVDDNFHMYDYSYCREYKVDNDADDGNKNVYYVGPTCNGNGIKLGFFSDKTCTTVPTKTFYEISNGWTLPYSEELVSTYCDRCAANNTYGVLTVNSMCKNLYADSTSKCETNMATVSANGKDVSGCTYVKTISPAQASSGAGATIGWIIFALVIVGVAGYGYTKWWVKRKNGPLANEGVMN